MTAHARRRAPLTDRAMLARHMQDRHRRAVRSLATALTLDEPATWWTLASLWRHHHLTRDECAMLAFVALRTLDPADRELVAEAALDGEVTP